MRFREGNVQWWTTPVFRGTDLFKLIRDEWREDRLAVDKVLNRKPGRESGLRFDPFGRYPVFVKKYFQRHRLEAIKYLFKPTRAALEFNNNAYLHYIGIGVPRILAMAEDKLWGLWQRSLLVMEVPDNAVTLKQWSETEGPLSNHRALTRRLANDIARLHNQGIYYCDLHAANILLEQDTTENPMVYFVDLNEVQAHRSIVEKQCTDDLARLNAFVTTNAMTRLRFLILYFRTREIPKQQWSRWLTGIHQRTLAIWCRYERKHPGFERMY